MVGSTRGAFPNATVVPVSTVGKHAVLNQPLAALNCREPGALLLQPGTTFGRIHRPCAPKYPVPPPSWLRAEPAKNCDIAIGTPLRIVVIPLTRHPETTPPNTPSASPRKRLPRPKGRSTPYPIARF